MPCRERFRTLAGRVDFAGRHSYCETVKNITLTVDDQSYRAARRVAAERDTSVSAMVREYLASLAAGRNPQAASERAEKKQRLRLVDLLEQSKLDLTGRPTREASYAHRRFH